MEEEVERLPEEFHSVGPCEAEFAQQRHEPDVIDWSLIVPFPFGMAGDEGEALDLAGADRDDQAPACNQLFEQRSGQ